MRPVNVDSSVMRKPQEDRFGDLRDEVKPFVRFGYMLFTFRVSCHIPGHCKAKYLFTVNLAIWHLICFRHVASSVLDTACSKIGESCSAMHSSDHLRLNR